MLRKTEPHRPCKEPVPTPDSVTIGAGYASVYFVTDPGDFVAELHDALVLVSTDPIGDSAQLVPILEAVAMAALPILVVAPAIAPEPLALLVANKLRGILYANAIVVANASSVAADLGCKAHGASIERVSIAELGKTRRAISGATTTVIQTTAVRL
jgi:chaperonin GroEL (HSP60 family)